MERWSDVWWPPPSQPLPAKGGIRSRKARGSFAESWWGLRWIEVLEGFPIGARLRRGRSYARKGQVLDIQVEPGGITARVQGSRETPYEVTVEIDPLTAEERHTVVRELAERTRLAASLLAGEMPRDLEDAFRVAGVPLFPEGQEDLATDCSCPDWSNPCKHIAAVFYLVAEELDGNPFLLLRLRGLARADLVEGTGDGVEAEEGEAADGEAGSRRRAALPSDPELFWSGAAEPGDEHSPPPGEGTTAVHLRALGRIPFWRGAKVPTTILQRMSRRGAELALEVLAEGSAQE